jgi:hypothetical protein
VLAHMWLNLGAYNGGDLAGRDHVATLMTTQQIWRAEDMATACLASGYVDCD